MHPLLAKLSAPFPIEAVSWRVASMNKDRTRGMAVCYIDARDVQGRLDSVMGVDWSDEIVVQSSGLVTCRIGLLINGEWRYRQDASSAVRESKPLGDLSPKEDQEREMHQKGAVSDAFKRASVKWGVGRYLYEMDSPWVAIDQHKAIQKADLPKLRAVLEQHYRKWSTVQPHDLRPVQQPHTEAPPKPTQGAATLEEVIDPETGEILLPDSFDKDQDWVRIVTLLKGYTKNRDDVHQIIGAENNKAAIDRWPEPWKAVMRGIVREALSKFPERQAA